MHKEENKLSLYEKLMEVRRAVDYLQKAQANKAQGFDYVSSSQVLGSIRVKMNDLGLILRPRIHKATLHHKGTTESMHFTELLMTMTWIDTETGEKETNVWYSQGADQHEKGVGKALTYAEKFFVLKYFNIPTDKFDPDAWEEKFGDKGDKGSGKGEKGPRKPSKPAQNRSSKSAPANVPQKGTEQSEGEKPPVKMPEMTGGPFKTHGQRIKAFIKVAGDFKQVLGEEKYYEILKQYKFEKSNQVKKRDDMNAIYQAFKQAVAEMMGGEVVK